jgi:hypothetical protein
MGNREILVVFRGIFFALLFAVIFSGCNPQPQNGSTETSNGDFVTKVIDGCEYIEYDNGIMEYRVYSLTHKGNCKFCAERSKR